MLDIYRMRDATHSSLIIGGFGQFESAAMAVSELALIDRNERELRKEQGLPNAGYRVFTVKKCTHIDGKTAKLHQPTLDVTKLVNAYYGLNWKEE